LPVDLAERIDEVADGEWRSRTRMTAILVQEALAQRAAVSDPRPTGRRASS
jgi:CopG-like RHH_1 or ribbon-helix-helix domain, RHH_5